MFKSLFKSAIVSSWFNSGVMIFSSFVAIPVVITKLSLAEINVFSNWNFSLLSKVFLMDFLLLL